MDSTFESDALAEWFVCTNSAASALHVHDYVHRHQISVQARQDPERAAGGERHGTIRIVRRCRDVKEKGDKSTGNSLTHEQPGQWRTYKLRGLNVYNQKDEKIGDISDILADSRGRIQAVVVGAGGFPGIGGRNVAVPFNDIRFVNESRASASAALDHYMAAANNRNVPATTGAIATSQATDAVAHQAPDHAVLMMNMTKDQLKAAPEFKYAR